jgi:hypothetical protein
MALVLDSRTVAVRQGVTGDATDLLVGEGRCRGTAHGASMSQAARTMNWRASLSRHARGRRARCHVNAIRAFRVSRLGSRDPRAKREAGLERGGASSCVALGSRVVVVQLMREVGLPGVCFRACERQRPTLSRHRSGIGLLGVLSLSVRRGHILNFARYRQ